MSDPRIAYTPRLGATPEGELNALTSVYHFIIDCHAKKKAAPESRPGDAMKGSNDDRACDAQYT